MTRPNHAHMYSDQGYSSVFVNRTKQVCLQTRLKWWEWWGTPDIIWNRVPDRRRSKRKWTITKCCLTVCRSIEKRHGVWAGASVAGVQWLFMQHVSDIWWCSTAVTVVAQTTTRIIRGRWFSWLLLCYYTICMFLGIHRTFLGIWCILLFDGLPCKPMCFVMHH